MFSRKSAKAAGNVMDQVTAQDAITAVRSMMASGTPFTEAVAAVNDILPARVQAELIAMFR